ncbi:MAG: class I SAM-dependent methyltransferase [Hyphomicrobiales bacterium]|nr:class I SAM-dependent methyltransferase [Hyphomicrobiales bacterium]
MTAQEEGGVLQRKADPAGRIASEWVERFLPGIPAGGTVLDVACGGGRHLRLAREAGHPVIGIDRNLENVTDVKQTPGVTLIEADLETGAPVPFVGDRFAGIIVTNYLWRPILPTVVAALAPGGILIYETFQVGQEAHGRPTNPDFLLRPNELLEACLPELEVLAFESGTFDEDGRTVVRQRICARRPLDPPTR